MQDRVNFKNGVSAAIFTNKNKLIKGNTVRDKFLVMADSTLFKAEADQPGGYLSIDLTTGVVNVALIKKAAGATGQVLTDNGTWEDIEFSDLEGDPANNAALVTFIDQKIAGVISSAPGALDTLNELAAALGDDPNFATTVTNLLATKENSSNKDASGGFVGLTLFKINFKNALNTFTSFLTNANTAARTYFFPDRDGTIADEQYVQEQFSTAITAEGDWDASGNTYPLLNSTGGTIKRGNQWQISVNGLGLTSPFSIIRALVDNPGQTPANWYRENRATAAIVTRIITVLTSSSTPTIVISSDNSKTDVLYVSGLTTNATFAVSGTPTNDKPILIYYKDNGIARTIGVPASFLAIGVTIPTTTTAGKWGIIAARWSASAAKWMVVHTSTEN